MATTQAEALVEERAALGNGHRGERIDFGRRQRHVRTPRQTGFRLAPHHHRVDQRPVAIEDHADAECVHTIPPQGMPNAAKPAPGESSSCSTKEYQKLRIRV